MAGQCGQGRRVRVVGGIHGRNKQTVVSWNARYASPSLDKSLQVISRERDREGDSLSVTSEGIPSSVPRSLAEYKYVRPRPMEAVDAAMHLYVRNGLTTRSK